jgi:hypothetical protein
MTQTCPYQKLRSNSFGGVEVPPIVRAGWVRREPIWCVRSTTQKSSRTTSPRREYAKSGVCSGGKTFVTMMQSANLRNLHDPTPWLEAESVD